MYRIEIKPGEENVFRTIEELATGIRNGLVTPKARIFHNASQKWLPIEFHPHYKKALKMPPTKSGETPAVVVPSAPSTASIFAPKPPPAPVLPAPVLPPPPLAPLAPAPQAMASIAPAPTPIRAPAPAPAPIPAPVVAAAPPPAIVAPVVITVPVVQAPVAHPAPAIAVVSPVVDLPTIAYDPPPLVEEDPLPVAHAPLGRTHGGRFRPLHLIVVAAVLIIGTYVAVSAASPSHKVATTSAVDSASAQAAQPAQAPVIEAQRRDSSPSKPGTAVAAATGGPTFGGPVIPGAPKHTIVTSSGASAAVGKDSADAIEPAPVEVDLSVPSLPSSDSLAPTVQSDSGIRRILRAVGGKGAPASQP